MDRLGRIFAGLRQVGIRKADPPQCAMPVGGVAGLASAGVLQQPVTELLRDIDKAWASGLSGEQKEAVDLWMMNESRPSGGSFVERFREWQLSEKARPADRAVFRAFRTAVHLAPDWQGTAWRGATLSATDIGKLTPGSVMGMRSITSFSQSKKAAASYASFSIAGKTPVLFEAKMKTGANIFAAYPEQFEKEVVARKDTTFRVVSTERGISEKTGKEFYKVFLEESE